MHQFSREPRPLPDPPRSLRLDARRGLSLLAALWRFGLFPGSRFLPFLAHRSESLAVRVRLAIEHLGMTYIKLGQFLAIRYDVLPPEVCRELENLFDDVAPLPSERVESAVSEALGRPLEECFAHFEPEPIAAASVAQVHRARTRAGELVAVKLQRPDLAQIFTADIRNLRRIARLIDAAGLFGRLSAAGMVGEFARWTLRELDFTREADTAERLAATALPFAVVPRVHWRLTTPRLLTMDFIDGISLGDLAKLLDEGGEQLARARVRNLQVDEVLVRLGEACLSQLFLSGFFHGDPHPGNILVLDDNRLAFVDFGIFGALSDFQRRTVAGMIESLAMRDLQGSLRYYKRQLIPTEETDMEAFERECLQTLGRWYQAVTDPSTPVHERHLAGFTGTMIDLSRRRGVRYGFTYLLFWRALNVLNASLWRIEPKYDLMRLIRDFFERHRPDAVERLARLKADPGWRAEVAAIGRSLPARLAETLDGLIRGQDQPSVEQSLPQRAYRRAVREARLAAAGLVLVSLMLFLSSDFGARLGGWVRATVSAITGLPLA